MPAFMAKYALYAVQTLAYNILALPYISAIKIDSHENQSST